MNKMKQLLIMILICSPVILSKSFSSNYRKNERIRIWAEVDDKKVNKLKSELTVFLPDPDKNNHSGVIICPGGSYAYLGMKVEGYSTAEWLNSLGFTAFVLRYRVGLQGYHFPAAIEDLQRSIQIVRENSKIWNLDTNKIGIIGYSAGGHLAGTAAIYYENNFLKPLGINPKVSLRPDFVVMYYPVISMHDSIANKKSKHFLMGKQIISKDLENKLSLEDNIHIGMPPIFLMQTLGDKTVNSQNSVNFERNMIKVNNQIKFILYNCSGHGFGINPKRNAIAAQWTEEFKKWISNLGYKTF